MVAMVKSSSPKLSSWAGDMDRSMDMTSNVAGNNEYSAHPGCMGSCEDSGPVPLIQTLESTSVRQESNPGAYSLIMPGMAKVTSA